MGTVTRIFYEEEKNRLVVFASVDDKFEIRCTIKNGIQTKPVKGDKVAIVIKDAIIDEEKNDAKIWGEIIHLYSVYF